MTNSTTQHNEVWSSGDIRDVAISWLPDGRTLALANGQGELRLQARTGKVLWRRECDAAVAGLTVSPDGAWLAVLDREQVLVHQTSTGELHLRHHLDGQPRFVCWGPGSRQLAVASADGVAVLDTRTGSDTWPRLPSGFDSTFGEWPVEGRLVLGGREGQIIVWDPRDDSEGARFMAGREPVRSLCALGDPWPLAVAAGSSVGLWQVAESAAQVARLGHADEVTLMAGCPRHGLVATATASGLMLWQTRKTPAESVKLALQGTTLRSLAFALNTGELAVLGTDGGIRFYDTSFLRSVPAATASLPEASAMSLDAYAAKQAATVGQRAVPVVRSPKWWVPTGLPGATGNCLGCLGEPCEQNGQDYGRGVALFGEDRFVAAGCL
ncbi:MAG: WD40 repeat domain-containing protein, partial [bacterium]|nr:WD40 repeat domain-containing protein [bacterium]